MESVQKQLQAEMDSFKSVQKEYHKALNQRQQLDGQFNENTVVKSELDLMKDGAEVYKLIGPVLVKQELVEAKQNVSKRMDYISGELKRVDKMIKALNDKQEGHKDRLNKLQTLFQQEQFMDDSAASESQSDDYKLSENILYGDENCGSVEDSDSNKNCAEKKDLNEDLCECKEYSDGLEEEEVRLVQEECGESVNENVDEEHIDNRGDDDDWIVVDNADQPYNPVRYYVDINPDDFRDIENDLRMLIPLYNYRAKG